MSTVKLNKFRIVILLLNLFLLPLQSEAAGPESDTRTFVASFTSMAEVKSKLRDAFKTLDSCQIGSCFNYNTMLICEIVAALDVKINGVIIGAMSSDKPDFTISADDLRHMKHLFAQCKPTNYQYWNYDTVLHVGYRPSDKADIEIRNYLGIKSKQ